MNFSKISFNVNKVLILSSVVLSFSLYAKEETPIVGSIKITKSASPLSSLAKISMKDASKNALLKNPGKVLSSILENEDGFLVYAVTIASNDHKIHEVLIDAGNGKLLDVNKEDGNKNDVSDGDGEENDD